MESFTEKILAFPNDWFLACDNNADDDDGDDGDDDDGEDGDDNNEVMNAESVSWCQRNFLLF